MLPTAARADPPITVDCNGAPCSDGWYTVDVTVVFHWDPAGVKETKGCDTKNVSSDTTGIKLTCTVYYDNGSKASLSVTIKRDATPPTVTGANADRGPDSAGWYNHPVGISFNGTDATSGIASCTSTTYDGPDGADIRFSGTCTDNAGNVSSPGSFGPIEYDATPPSVSGGLARGPDANGWYNHAVDFSATGTDNLSGIASCSSGTYGGPDTGGGSIEVRCSDVAGNTGSARIAIKYDATAPTVTGASAARPPDSNGWYNHPVAIAFTGSDGTSGVASCTNLVYSAPDAPNVTLTGSCTDGAGNTAAGGSFAFKYDATAPTLTDIRVESGDRIVTLSWRASPDTRSIDVVRRPGPSGPDAEKVFDGLASSYEDTNVANRVTYVYTITGADEAGNLAVQTISVVPAALLYSPARGATVRTPPLLAWRRVAGAAYYNVQVHFRGRKVLSAWPAQPRYRLGKRWTFGKKRYALVPGRYTWYVWPGFGNRSAEKYGPLLGKSEFVVPGFST